MQNRPFVRVFRLAVLIAVVGCQKASPLKTVKVNGTVIQKGTPIGDAKVNFFPVGDAGRPAAGTTDALGRYQLQTYVGGATFANGALAGDYTVTVVKAATQAPAAGPAAGGDVTALSEQERQNMIDQMQKAQQVATQASKGQAPLAGKVESELPLKYANPKTSDLKVSVKEGPSNEIVLELTD